MTPIIVVENEWITVTYTPEKHQVSHTFHQPVSGKPFQDAINAGTAAMIRHGGYKWLSDDRLNGPLSDEDREWGFNDWNLRAIKGGWKYWALVVPTDIMNAGTLSQTVADLFEKGLRVMVFDNVPAAQEWLDRF